MNPRFLSMIIPARWYAGGRGLDTFREEMCNDNRISNIVDYPKSRECFQGVDIAGGICYFLWQRDYFGDCEFVSITGDKLSRSIRPLNEFDVIIRENIGVDIIHKIFAIDKNMAASLVLKVSPFGLRSYVRGEDSPFKDCVTLYHSAGIGYIKKEDVKKNVELINKYKVCIGYLNPDRAGVNNASDGMSNVTTKIRILKPNEVVTETYIIPYVSENKTSVENYAKYLGCKFTRFLVWLTLSSMHIAQNNFAFVPIQDFSEPWTDEKLYAKYGLTDEEIAFIESMIRPMELSGGDADE